MVLGGWQPRVLADQSAAPVVEPAVEVEVQQMVEDFVQQRFADRTEKALNGVISAGVSVLAQKGFEQDAREIQGEWLLLKARGLFNSRDLGDHAPLNEWLSKTYAKLESKLGAELMHSFHLDDIKIFNFAIPVVFHPTKWDIKEYGLHFVPFGGATTYWISRLGCTIATSGLISWFCGTIAEVPRYAVVHWIAPGLGNKIHHKATGTSRGSDERLFDEHNLDLGGLFERAQQELGVQTQAPVSGEAY